jgi:site-specific DNA recombinase
MTQTYIAYIRVSTERQGNEGVSLIEQRRAITLYAERHTFTITAWYEERTTAAKRGRPVFKQVMQELARESGRVGLLMHKIDRGARNLRDWADIGDAIDCGIMVRFAHDEVDLHTRSGRLSADIQAVIAADYIRNLREEVRKGIQGRLRQGLYPFAAPRGYRNTGGGNAKVPDPVAACHVVAAFQRYATGAYSLRMLSAELAISGLQSVTGKPLGSNTLSQLLNNRFYVGQLVVKGQTFAGVHQPLISEALFSRVQYVLKSRHHHRPRHRHVFRYRMCLRCTSCNRHLSGESQKGYVYYRCGRCPGVCVREDRIGSRNPDKQRTWFLETPSILTLQPFSKFEFTVGVAQT